jgi:hypothetical protein
MVGINDPTFMLSNATKYDVKIIYPEGIEKVRTYN